MKLSSFIEVSIRINYLKIHSGINKNKLLKINLTKEVQDITENHKIASKEIKVY